MNREVYGVDRKATVSSNSVQPCVCQFKATSVKILSDLNRFVCKPLWENSRGEVFFSFFLSVLPGFSVCNASSRLALKSLSKWQALWRTLQKSVCVFVHVKVLWCGRNANPCLAMLFVRRFLRGAESWWKWLKHKSLYNPPKFFHSSPEKWPHHSTRCLICMTTSECSAIRENQELNPAYQFSYNSNHIAEFCPDSAGQFHTSLQNYIDTAFLTHLKAGVYHFRAILELFI